MMMAMAMAVVFAPSRVDGTDFGAGHASGPRCAAGYTCVHF